MGKGGENVKSSEKALRRISVEELSKHRTMDDAWLAYKGKVYDISKWYDHPGGSVIFTHAGDDCTDIFAAFHPPSAYTDLSRFEIGVLDETIISNANKLKPEKQKQFEQAYRDIRTKMIQMGLFNASPLYYTYKIGTNLAILAASVYLVVNYESFLVHFVAAVLLGIFWQQCGWLSHDFLHHQVFKNRKYGDMMGLIIGDFFPRFLCPLVEDQAQFSSCCS